jgi:hypothetical protein
MEGKQFFLSEHLLNIGLGKEMCVISPVNKKGALLCREATRTTTLLHHAPARTARSDTGIGPSCLDSLCHVRCTQNRAYRYAQTMDLRERHVLCP